MSMHARCMHALPGRLTAGQRLPSYLLAARGRLRGRRGRRALSLHLGRLGASEEGVGDGLEGRDALGRAVGEHPHEEVLQLQVVGHAVPRLVEPPPVGPARLDAQHLVERAVAQRAGRVAQHVARAVCVGTEVLEALGAALYHLRGRRAEQLVDLDDLVALVLPAEERLPRVHLDEDAAEAPHVDLGAVAAAEQHLGGAVEARLDVRVDRLAVAARGAEVDELDGGAPRVPQQDVLRLEVAVDDRDVAQREEAEGLEDALAELADEVERDALEARVPQQVIEVVREHLEDEALVAAEHKVLEQAHDAGRVAHVLLVEELEQLDLRLGLLQEGLLALDDLDRHPLLRRVVERLDHLPEGALTDDRAHRVAIVEELPILDDVVIVLIVPAMVEEAPLSLFGALPRLVGTRGLLLLPPLALLVINLRGRGAHGVSDSPQ
eukprot:scaffold119065_cov63-Phaeocystis_antarctica.AAC.1